ncbi:uncharacterized protein LOC132785189 [Drosophila nasuta]|uniref:uncharacterized protein LOC132785189 n=1 Tax=Drosophila nasuta TaxID=42062 RepID=UPI00295E84D0|nr:uncharacterized protein LOC132785189 [Drosophila nasuta]
MKLLLILLLAASVSCEEDSDEEVIDDRPIPTVSVDQIKIYGERKYILAQARIHEDRRTFDIHARIIRELGSNNLIMNVNMRAKFENENEFKKIFELRRLDFCVWLTEYNENFFLRAFFKKSMTLSEVIECPVRVGNISLHNVNMADNVYPQNMVPGTYKYFLEIVEVTGDLPKVFALQVTTRIYIKKE